MDTSLAASADTHCYVGDGQVTIAFLLYDWFLDHVVCNSRVTYQPRIVDAAYDSEPWMQTHFI